MKQFDGHGAPVRGVAWSPDGASIATAGDDRSVRVWATDAGTQRAAFADLPGPVVGVAFSPDGTLLAAGGPSFLRVWEVATGQERFTRPGPAEWVAFSPDGTVWAGSAAVGPDAGPARLARFDPAGTEQARFEYPEIETAVSFALSVDGRTLYVAGQGRGVVACDPRTGRPLAPRPAPLTADEHRQLAERALAAGGQVWLAGGQHVRQRADLPDRAFVVEWLELGKLPAADWPPISTWSVGRTRCPCCT